MIFHIVLSLLSVSLLVSASNRIYSSGTRMLKHRRIGGINNNSTAGDYRRAPKLFRVTDQYTGSNFFDGWDFFSQADPTNGNVNYLNKNDAFAKKLAFVENGTAVMKVDDTNFIGAGQNRDSVRIASTKTYTGGLFVLDVQTMPHGCGVWPAWWTVGSEWPNNGEIDILEGVHDQQFNQMTLHTAAGCSLDTGLIKPKSTILTRDCNAAVNFNTGCAFLDTDTASYGAGLNAAGGGVFAMLWDDDGISVWFFPRNSVPADLQNLTDKGAMANPTTWGVPKAHWASSGCSTTKFFKNHSLVFDTTLCGDWAGATYSSAGCPGTCADRLKDPANFKDAVWRINSVTVMN
ncbi:glycoside hydrolase family 16 protein [Ceratobasidium sp. AG-Ba]|nr:glycoside hydrolase family 16 protein [Ceratobasidium sp. AG-Ba]